MSSNNSSTPAAPPAPLDDIFWEDLLYAIGEGTVVPIVGRDLLLVKTDQGERPFYRIAAERLARDLRVKTDGLPPDFDMNDVACAYKEQNADLAAVNDAVARILRTLSLPTPEPLKLLAQIPNFQLFISTTIDSLLEDAIASVRGCRPAVGAFPPSTEVLDYDEAKIKEQGSLVFHILGLVSSSSSFAVTEGQMLEIMHDFMTSEGRPTKLINKLQQSHLLILGVDFPDWLARFLLRIARKNPLWNSRSISELFADPRAMKEDFSRFLRYFSTQKSTIYPGGNSVQFVNELYQRWSAKNATQAAAQPAGEISPWVPGSIFISHASEDYEPAFRLADELTKAGVEVWVDRRLNPGDGFRDIINYHIRECAAFVAVLSGNTNNEDGPGRWFRDEWAQARDMSKRFTGTNRNFIFPVIVDQTAASNLNAIRRDVFGCSAVNAPGGVPASDLIGELNAAQRMYRKQFARA
jgi:TIR domain/SIR2-like domain